MGNTDNSFQDIDCAIYCSYGTLMIYERGSKKLFGKTVGRTKPMLYTENNVLSVRRSGTTVTFLKDAVYLRTCGIALSGPVNADVSVPRQRRPPSSAAAKPTPPPPPTPPTPDLSHERTQ